MTDDVGKAHLLSVLVVEDEERVSFVFRFLLAILLDRQHKMKSQEPPYRVQLIRDALKRKV